jgi:uncharacterized OsmC-like protein
MSDTFEIRLERLEGYRFRTDFGTEGVPPLIVDEPPPLGEGTGPNPARLLAAAVGDCLSASLLFCLGKSRVEVAGVKTRVAGTYRRNERGRLRIAVLDVSIQVDAPGSDPAKLGKCLEMFERLLCRHRERQEGRGRRRDGHRHPGEQTLRQSGTGVELSPAEAPG